MTTGSVLIGCDLCGGQDTVTVRFVQAGLQVYDVEVVERERLELFWAAHRKPWARALTS